MKMNGKTFAAPTGTVVIPRDTGNVVFQVQGVTSFDEFESLVKEPVAPTIRARGKPDIVDKTDPAYVEAVADYGKMRIAYIVIRSLEPTPGLEWESLSIEDPSTWQTWDKELAKAGFTPFEIQYLIGEIMAVNGLGEDRYKDAKASFLASHPPGPAA